VGIPDNFIEHGTVSELQEIVGLDKESILKEIKKLLP
jgi:1-deoxy-D-xylulose-5-phosphate synthase